MPVQRPLAGRARLRPARGDARGRRAAIRRCRRPTSSRRATFGYIRRVERTLAVGEMGDDNAGTDRRSASHGSIPATARGRHAVRGQARVQGRLPDRRDARADLRPARLPAWLPGLPAPPDGRRDLGLPAGVHARPRHGPNGPPDHARRRKRAGAHGQLRDDLRRRDDRHQAWPRRPRCPAPGPRVPQRSVDAPDGRPGHRRTGPRRGRPVPARPARLRGRPPDRRLRRDASACAPTASGSCCGPSWDPAAILPRPSRRCEGPASRRWPAAATPPRRGTSTGRGCPSTRSTRPTSATSRTSRRWSTTSPPTRSASTRPRSWRRSGSRRASPSRPTSGCGRSSTRRPGSAATMAFAITNAPRSDHRRTPDRQWFELTRRVPVVRRRPRSAA